MTDRVKSGESWRYLRLGFLIWVGVLVCLAEIARAERCDVSKNGATMGSENKQPDAMNVLGTPLVQCGCSPMTGFFRDGFCHTEARDVGRHTVCAIVTEEFLTFTRDRGNDLSTPALHFGFPGLKAGDRWCLCVSRWLEAYQAGVAPPVILEATHQNALKTVTIEQLRSKALQ